MADGNSNGVKLSQDELDIIETNRNRALALQLERQKKRAEEAELAGNNAGKRKRGIDLNYCDYNLSTMDDTRAGFLIEKSNDRDEDAIIPAKLPPTNVLDGTKGEDANHAQHWNLAVGVRTTPPCRECKSLNTHPQYLEGFNLAVCRDCIEKFPEKYTLLTKTECREDYLLTEPEMNDKERLKRIEKPNPHKSTWNNMLLFVREQVEEFALDKWKTWEALDAEFDKRQKLKEERKKAQFQKKLAQLRKKTRTSTWKADLTSTSEKHVHKWSEKSWDEGEQMYRQICTDCGVSTLFDEI